MRNLSPLDLRASTSKSDAGRLRSRFAYRPGKQQKLRRFYRLGLEQLEDRIVLSNVLLIYDTINADTNSLTAALAGAGNTITLRATSETGYNGTNPSPAGFDAVIHLDGTTYSTPMPAAGQIEAPEELGAGEHLLGETSNPPPKP